MAGGVYRAGGRLFWQPRPPSKPLSQKGMIRHRWCSREYDKAFMWPCHPQKHHFVHPGHKPLLHSVARAIGPRGASRPTWWPTGLCGHSSAPSVTRFAAPRDVQEHQVPHSGQHPLSCQQCGKAFAHWLSLCMHREIHLA